MGVLKMLPRSTRSGRLNLITIMLMALLFIYLYMSSTTLTNECMDALRQKLSQNLLTKLPPNMKDNLPKNSFQEVRSEASTRGHDIIQRAAEDQQAIENGPPKIILAYTTLYGNIFNVSSYGRVAYERNAVPDPMAACQHKCKWSTDVNDLSNADAVLFHLYNNLKAKDFVLKDIPPRNSENVHQKWIFMSREPQSFYYPDQLALLDDMFNLTMTFQRDSDVTIPYGSYWNLTEKSLKYRRTIELDYHTGKTKLVAWVASNCVTSGRRENYVKELQKYIEVDVYGNCGNLRTPTNDANGFRKELSKTYMFYLAFENSDCVDYISEKFWHSLEAGIIPVVRGLKANYKHVAPANSYIQAENFINADGLAAYLKEVAGNQTLYNSFHAWRRLYDAKYKFFTVNTSWMCDLCEKVHTSKRKTVPISQHFGEDSRCFTYLSHAGRNRTGEHVEDITRV